MWYRVGPLLCLAWTYTFVWIVLVRVMLDGYYSARRMVSSIKVHSCRASFWRVLFDRTQSRLRIVGDFTRRRRSTEKPVATHCCDMSARQLLDSTFMRCCLYLMPFAWYLTHYVFHYLQQTPLFKHGTAGLAPVVKSYNWVWGSPVTCRIKPSIQIILMYCISLL